jgi:hypothetical protein
MEIALMCNSTDNDALMDFHNNIVGHGLGQQYELAALADRVCDELREGRLKVLDGVQNPNADLIPSNQAGCDC